MPHAFIRERIPRAVPGGGWARLYGIGCAGLGYVEVPDGDFTAFETALHSSGDAQVLHQYPKRADKKWTAG